MHQRNLLSGLFAIWLGFTCFVEATPAHAAKADKKPSQAQQQHQQHLRYLNVMSSEMKRLLGHLNRRPHPRVYYMRYRLQSLRTVSLYARDGLLGYTQDTRKSPRRTVQVQLRVGSHQFDQTGRVYIRRLLRTLLPAGRICPSELSPALLRKFLWKNTDRNYRIAVAKYWKKRYVRNLKARIRDKSGDFTKEPPTVYMASLEPRLSWNRKHWSAMLKRITRVTRKIPGVLTSSVRVYGVEKVILGVASDGSRVRQRDVSYHWSMTMKLLGKNKEVVYGSASGYAPTENKLPSEATLQKEFRKLWKRLHDTVKAEEGEPGEGPTLVDPQLASAMFYDILMIRLGTQRFLKRYSARTFEKKLGKRIMPSFIDIVDDPTRSVWQGTHLSAHYLYDDQWIRARPLVMVKNGVLKSFYMSRKPYKQWKRSNGHGRAAFGYYSGFSRPSVIFVKSRRTLTQPQMLQRLKTELRRQKKRYGYLVRGLQGSSSVYSGTFYATPADIFRFDLKTGQFKRVKRIRIRTSALGILEGILATGKKAKVFNGSDSENSGLVPISVISPGLLLKSVSFQRRQAREKKPFEIPPPFVAQAGFPAPRKATIALSPLQGRALKACHELCQCPEKMLQWTAVNKMACLNKQHTSSFLSSLCSTTGACGKLYRTLHQQRQAREKKKKKPGKSRP